MFLLQPNFFDSHIVDVIISLTTTPARFHYELPLAIHSLLCQTELPKQIRVYLSPASLIKQQTNMTLAQLRVYVQNLDSSETMMKLFNDLVDIWLEEEDFGPATKFLPIIKEFKGKSQRILICDDDQYYHPYTVATLYHYSARYPKSILGFRGWRVRQDLFWGVGGHHEIAYHIIESFYISQIYRVGVITANHAYLIRPSFFDEHIYDDFNKVSNDIRHVDDIWINGQASARNISRYVVPSCCSHITVTRTHALEEYFGRNRMDRLTANNHALRWFADRWEKDLWYKFGGENAPRYRNWFVLIYRQWIFLLLQFKFVMYFGFV
ncbi:unnamed protein product [Adineta ricciae]|uniref:Glycosyltransferase 2-like domain-containing protein n=1 Tax=Adineta ricciae TaxID=249248 RepID=A0A814Z1K5_ADIRI|nr:unnamed protein product [Adineta ricciae]